MFVIHWAGNDISDEGPYPGGATDIDTNCRAMLADLKALGFKVCLSTTTYRIPPASNPSDPYNVNVMNPIIADTSLVDIPMDWYTLSFDNQLVWHDTDDLHPTAAGEQMNRDDIVSSIVPHVQAWVLIIV